MATHSSVFAWRIPWTEEPGGLPVHGVAQEADTTWRLNNICLILLIETLKATGFESKFTEKRFSVDEPFW